VDTASSPTTSPRSAGWPDDEHPTPDDTPTHQRTANVRPRTHLLLQVEVVRESLGRPDTVGATAQVHHCFAGLPGRAARLPGVYRCPPRQATHPAATRQAPGPRHQHRPQTPQTRRPPAPQAADPHRPATIDADTKP
jgi:hypothetical protein